MVDMGFSSRLDNGTTIADVLTDSVGAAASHFYFLLVGPGWAAATDPATGGCRHTEIMAITRLSSKGHSSSL